jgi:hypothetical protein
MRRKARLSRIPLSFSSNEQFQIETTKTLKTQDQILASQNQLLEHLVKKLEAPVLNGGFDELTQKMTRMETIQTQMVETQKISSQQVAEIHKTINDPKEGLIVTLSGHGKWISSAKKVLIWLGAGGVTVLVGALGKLGWSFVTGHIHFIP